MRWLLNNTNLFLLVLEAGDPEIEVLGDLVSGESQLFGSHMASYLMCPLVMGETRELSVVSLILFIYLAAPGLSCGTQDL